MTRATSVIDDCINKLKIRGKRKEKWAKTGKKGHVGKHTRPKKWSGARRSAGPATTALSKSRDFRILKYGGFFSKPLDSGKTYFDISVNTDQIALGFEADTPEKWK